MNTKEKKILTTSVALGAALTAGTAVTTNVHAATTNDNAAVNQDTSAKQTVGQRQDEAQKAQQTYDDANSALDAAKTNVNQKQSADQQAQTNVDNAQSKVNDAQKANDSAQADLNNAKNATDAAKAVKDEATPDNIAKAQQAVTDQNTTIANAKDAANKADQAVTDQNTTIANDQKSVNDAKDNQATKKSAQDDAQKNVDQAKKALDGTGVEEAETAQQKAQATVTADNSVLADAKDKQSTAQSNFNDADAALKNAKTAQANAQSDYDTKKATANNADNSLATAKANTKVAQDNVDAINTKLENTTTITVPSGYGDALKRYLEYQGKTTGWDANQAKALSNAVTSLGKQALQDNVFKDDPADKNITIDISNLDATTRQELSIYAAGLMNQVRSQLGIANLSVTPLSVEYANAIANRYNSDNWNMNDPIHSSHPHDVAGLDDVDKQYNVYSGGENAGVNNPIFTQDYYVLEDGTALPKSTTQTLYDIKHVVYCDMIAMLFDDASSSWGHAGMITGENGYTDDMTVGFSMDKYYNTHYDYAKNEENNGFADNAYTIPTVDTLVQQLATARTDLANKQAAQATAQKASDNAHEAEENAKTTLDNANSAVASAQGTYDSTNTILQAANQKVAQAQGTLDADQSILDQANQVLNQYRADYATKMQALEDANKALTKAQNDYQVATKAVETANQTLTDAKNKLADLQKTASDKHQAVTDAQNDLKTKQAALDRLQNADANYQKALADLQAKQTVYDNAASALKNAQDALNTARKAKDQAANDLTQAQLAVQAAKNAVDEAKAALWTDAKIYGDQAKINDITIHAGENVPAPVMNNTFGDETLASTTNQPEAAMFITMPAMNGESATTTMRTWDGNLPTGTTAAWANASQVNADAQVPGDHVEDVLVTFPDGSTTTVHVTLHVLANPTTHETNYNVSLPNGYKIVNGQVVDANGNPVAGWAVKNGRVYNANGQLVADLAVPANGTITTSAKNDGQKTNALPQTGDQNETAIAALGLVGLSLMTVLGLRKRD